MAETGHNRAQARTFSVVMERIRGFKGPAMLAVVDNRTEQVKKGHRVA